MVKGYRKPTPILDRLAAKSVADGDCLLWQGYTQPDGYGRLTIGSRIDGTRRLAAVHRAAWEAFHSRSVPDGMDIDHTCKRRNCWAREHLRALPPAINRSTVNPELAAVRRANLVKARAVWKEQKAVDEC